MSSKKPRILLFSDLHVKPESATTTLGILDAILKELDSHGEIDAVGFLGDFFHLRYHVPVDLLNAVSVKLAEIAAWRPLILLPGNHDQIDLDGRNALEVFSEFEGIKVYTNPTIDEWGLWIPYRKPGCAQAMEVAEAINSLSAVVGAKKIKTCFAHLPIKGAKMNNHMSCTDGYGHELFSGFDHVLLGHYHKRQLWDQKRATGGTTKFAYLGSPWQTRADEYNQLKGFAYWTPSQKQPLKFEDRIWGPRFHRIESQGSLEHLDPKPGDHVHISADADYTLDVKALPEGCSVSYEVPEEDGAAVRFGFGKSTTLSEYAQAYIEDHKTEELTASELLKTFEALL